MNPAYVDLEPIWLELADHPEDGIAFRVTVPDDCRTLLASALAAARRGPLSDHVEVMSECVRDGSVLLSHDEGMALRWLAGVRAVEAIGSKSYPAARVWLELLSDFAVLIDILMDGVKHG